MAKKKSEKSVSSRALVPPVVVVLGHVDHGKTTLLDAIRKTDVAAGEYGGITQSIGAYQVTVNPEDEYASRVLTFIDTPGHEAFSAMRLRGIKVADIAILVVAANDSVMPQTIESIKIIQEAKIPFIVAINKVDLPEANVDKVISDLGRQSVQLENYGGKVPWIKISAKKSEGIPELLDLIDLVFEMEEHQSNPESPLEAIIIEAKLDKNRGPVATLVVRNGTVRVADHIFVGNQEAKVRALTDYLGQNLTEAKPGTPVEILGLTFVPKAGEVATHTPGEFTGQPSTFQSQKQDQVMQRPVMGAKVEGDEKLGLILKTDTLGSLEAIINKLPTNVDLLSSGTGEITEADVLLAKSTKGIILGFNTKVSGPTVTLAESEKVLVRTYKIIYELLDELADAAAGALKPVETEEVLGTGKIVTEFPFDKLRICGTKIVSGRLAKGDTVRINRGETLVGQAKIKSLRLGKEEATKVEAGKQCGVLLEPQVDFRPEDDIIAYRVT